MIEYGWLWVPILASLAVLEILALITKQKKIPTLSRMVRWAQRLIVVEVRGRKVYVLRWVLLVFMFWLMVHFFVLEPIGIGKILGWIGQLF